MDWVVFACSFPSPRSTPRVAVWRRLRRAGAVTPKAGLYLLPGTDECLEAVQWVAEEARAEGGDPIVIRAEAIEGLSESQLIELFRDARREDYAELLARADAIEQQPDGGSVTATRAALERLRADYQQLQRIDFFDTPEGRQAGARLDALAATFSQGRAEPGVAAVPRDAYLGRTWVTRPRPFVDRLACAWLIRRFIDTAAAIRYADSPAEGEVSFDMNDAEFRHVGNRCTFEVMVEAFGLREPALLAIGEIVHELDLQDGRYARPEVVGLELVLTGWRESERKDEALEAAGVDLFDGLYVSLRRSARTR